MKRGPIPPSPLRWRKKPLQRVYVSTPPTRAQLEEANRLEREDYCVELVPLPRDSTPPGAGR